MIWKWCIILWNNYQTLYIRIMLKLWCILLWIHPKMKFSCVQCNFTIVFNTDPPLGENRKWVLDPNIAFLPSSVPVCSSVPVELGVGFTFPSNNNNKNPHLISQLLLTRFWPNFKSRYLGTSWRDFSCHGDICPGNVSPGDICPYQHYLSSMTQFLPNFWDPIFWGTQFLWTKLLL